MSSEQLRALHDWMRVKDAKQAVRDARTLPERLGAICDYQGALAKFAELHWHRIDQAVRTDPKPEEVTAKPKPRTNPRLARLERAAAQLQADIAAIRAEEAGEA